MTEIAVIGDECGLTPSFLADVVEQFHTRRVPDVTAATFDDDTDAWLLHTAAGESHVARIVVDNRTPHLVPAPTVPGGNDFDGPLFHSAQWPADFSPAGKRVAVIGDRAAHVVPALAGSTVTVFDCPPTWKTRRTRSRWMPRRAEPSGPRAVVSPVRRITQSGIETADGIHYDADAIVFATHCTVAEQALVGPASAPAYLGVAAHGFPNYFMLGGPDSPVGDTAEVADTQGRYIADCLQLMHDKGGTRIEVRRSAQRQYIERGRVTAPARAFEVGSGLGSEVYDGPARLTVDDDEHPVRVRLTGRLDPIDGKYHWQGMVFDADAELSSRPVRLTVDQYAVEARIVETTPWGSYSITGVGAPPFAAQT